MAKKVVKNPKTVKPLAAPNTYISVSIVSDTEIRQLNKDYLDRDYPTDVLSFSINEVQDNGGLYLGDVVVNREQAQRQASDYGNDLEHEISELVAHGVLHLLGVHHPDDDDHSIHGIKLKSQE